MLDYIVVGLGLSGIAVTHELEKRGKSFVVFEDGSSNSSMVAGGVYNPVILKRFTPAGNAAEELPVALKFYKELEAVLKCSFHREMNIFRRFTSVEEQNNWFQAADKQKLEPFLSSEIEKEINPQVKGNFGFGKVERTGFIDTSTLISNFKKMLRKKSALIEEKFQYRELEISASEVKYKNQKAKAVIFCEGFGMKKNPFFNYLPLHGNKGEYITIKSQELKLEVMLKSSVFVIPLGNDLYKVGATYKHGDLSKNPTAEAREELLEQLKDLIKCNFEVIDQEAGIRPSIKDRRPIVGQHPEYKNLFICNGFGSRGVIIAPVAALEVLKLCEDGIEPPREMNINRFTKEYYSS